MKKINLILIALMALIFVSCSEDETTMSIPQESNAIEFGTYVGRDAQTRAPVLDDAVLKTGAYAKVGFGVLAYYTDTTKWTDNAKHTPNFMWNQQVKWDATSSGAWKYSPIKYWPTTQNDKVSFFAYAPYNAQTVETTSTSTYGIKLSGNNVVNNPTIEFTLQSSPSDMVDLVTASVMDVVGAGTPEAVNFTFQHALSRVNFIAKASELLNNGTAANKTIINITNVKLDASDQFYKSGLYTLSSTDKNGLWTLKDEDKAADYTLTDDFLNKTKADHGTEDKKYNESGIKLEGDSAVKLFNDNEYLFLIPLAENGLTESGVKVTFTYDIVTTDANLEKGYSVTNATKTVALPEGTLKQGVAYNYTFTFNVNEVVVTATVDEWDATETGTGTGTVDYGTPDVTP